MRTTHAVNADVCVASYLPTVWLASCLIRLNCFFILCFLRYHRETCAEGQAELDTLQADASCISTGESGLMSPHLGR
uniref:Secreted protein n=1 Tax=Knipowitschia caucasica TaxID=637954 RepID=A0AAV2LKY7_KNICA